MDELFRAFTNLAAEPGQNVLVRNRNCCNNASNIASIDQATQTNLIFQREFLEGTANIKK